MVKESIVVEMDEKDVKELVAEKWGLDPKTCTISISHLKVIIESRNILP